MRVRITSPKRSKKPETKCKCGSTATNQGMCSKCVLSGFKSKNQPEVAQEPND